MHRRYAAWLRITGFLAWTILGAGHVAATETDAVAPADPRLDMVRALQATAPHSSLADQTKAFERLIGTWDVQYTDFARDGTASHRSGELIFGWVMDGRAIQDVWIVDPSGARKEREIYTELRYVDQKSQTWRATFIDPEGASVARFTGGVAGADRIVLESRDFDGTETRWSFNDIRPDSLVYREETSRDGGSTWQITAEYRMKRLSRAPVAP